MRFLLTCLVCVVGLLPSCKGAEFVRLRKDAGSRSDGTPESGVDAGGRGRGGSGGVPEKPEAGGTPASTGGRPPVSGAKDASVDGADAESGSACDASSCGDAAIHCTKTEDCPEDRYCGSAGLCVRCTDLGVTDPARILFGEPEPLSAVNAGATIENLRTPRVFEGGSKLLYVHDFIGATAIWLTGDFRVDPGTPLGPPIDRDGDEGNPLKVSMGAGMFGGYNFFFDRTVPDDGGVSGIRIMYGARVDSAGRTTAVTALPPPFNAFPRIGYGFALSEKRAFWTERLDNALNIQLWTAPVEGDIITARVNLTLHDCPLYELDYTVWSPWDGRFILLSYSERDENCTQAVFTNDIGLLRVNSKGQAVGDVVPLNVDVPGISDTDPSLSPDMCFMYFVSTREDGHLYRIYRSRRMR